MTYKYGQDLVLNVKETPFNAKGDGIADDTAAIQTAITAALNVPTGGSVFIPAGTYKITNEIVISNTSPHVLRVYGEGDASIVNFNVSGAAFAANTTDTIEVDHLHFTGSMQYGIYIGFGSFCWIHDNFFDNCITAPIAPLAGIILVEVNDAWIYSNRFIGNGVQSTTLDQGQVVASGTNPPVVTLSGIPVSTITAPIIEITTGGIGTAAIFQWSTNGGSSWTTNVPVATSVVLGASGLTANFTVSGVDTYSTDNVYQGSMLFTGTSPPAVWLSGTPSSVTGAILIKITTGGTLASGLVRFQWSQNNGVSWTTGVTAAATVVLGSTGMTANFTADTYSTDNVYTAPYFSAYAGYAISQYFGYYASRIHVRDNYIENTWLPYGILLYNCDHSEVHGNTVNLTGPLNREAHFVDSSGYGVAFYSFSPVYHNRVENNTIDNTSGMGIYLQDCWDSAVVGNVLTNTANNAVATSLKQGAITSNVGSVSITSNVIKTSGIYGITIEGNYCTVVGNRIDSCASASILLDNLTTMSYFTVQGNQVSNGFTGIYSPLGCSNGSIVGNTFYNMAQPAAYLVSAADIIISNNQIDTITNDQYGIYLDSTSARCIVNDNSFSNMTTFGIASNAAHSTFRGNMMAATCPLGLVSSGEYCTISDNDFSQVTEDQYLVSGLGSVLKSTTAILDARDYGIDLTGTVDATPGLMAAYTEALNAGTGILNFAAGTYNIAHSINFPAGLTYKFARGAVFNIASGSLITFFDKVEADPTTQIFSGSGTAHFAQGVQPHVWADWWGTSNLQSAITAASYDGYGIQVLLNNTIYDCTSAITIPTSTTIKGAVSQDQNTTEGTVISFQGTGAGFVLASSAVEVTISNALILTDGYAGPAIGCATSCVASNIILRNLKFILNNPAQPAIAFGSYASAVQVEPFIIDHCNFTAATYQSTPLIASYSISGGTSNGTIRNCIFTGTSISNNGTTLSGTVTVSASTTVTFSTAQTLTQGQLLTFSSQPTVCYEVATATSSSTTATLTQAYYGSTTGSGYTTTAVAEMVHIESTDTNTVTNIAIDSCEFEIPYTGAIKFRGVRDSRIINCWMGDLAPSAPIYPQIFIGRSTASGYAPVYNIIIDNLQADGGVQDAATIHQDQSDGIVITVQNSTVPYIQNVPFGGPYTANQGYLPVMYNGATFGGYAGDQPTGILGNVLQRVWAVATAPETLTLVNGLNSNVTGTGNIRGAYRISGPTANFSIDGIYILLSSGTPVWESQPLDGVEVSIYNPTSNTMTIVPSASSVSTSQYQIITPGPGGNVPIPGPGTAKFKYDITSTKWILTSPSPGDITLSGDVTGNANANTVIQARDGYVLFTSSGNIEYSNTVTTPSIFQQSESTATQGTNLTIQPQQSTQASNQGGGNLIVALQAALGSGTEASFVVERGGTPVFATGGIGSSSYLWMGSDANTRSASDYLFEYTGASGNIVFGAGASSILSYASILSSTDVGASLGASSFRWLNVYSQEGMIGGTNSSTSGTNMTFTPEVGTPSSGNVQGGNAIIALQTPTGSGAEALLEVTRGGSFSASIGPYTGGGGSYSAVYLGPGLTPSSTNFTFLGNGSTLAFLNILSGGTTCLSVSGNSAHGIQMTTGGGDAIAFLPSVNGITTLGTSSFQWSATYTQQLYIQDTILNDGYSGAITTNGSTYTIYTEPAEAASSTYDYVVTVVGQNPSNGDVYRADFAFNYQRIGSAVPTVAGASPTPLNVRTTGAGNTYGGAFISTSVNSVIVQVSGLASTTVHWSCSFNRVQVS
jgi:parallel beta-helix repeat protein